MSTINYDLKKIKALVFDLCGVLSTDVASLHSSGEPIRTVNIKDGYALQLAVKQGFKIAIITGARTEEVRKRFVALGITDIYMGSAVKIHGYRHFREKYELKDEEILYMGDDIPDLEVMEECGLPACPADAVPEIKAISHYISHQPGGYGCGRDVVEQVMKAQGKWMTGDASGGRLLKTGSMLDNLKNYKLILASNSPRRKELIAGLGLEFTVNTLPDIDETFPDHLSVEEIPLHIATEKAKAYLSVIQPDELIITADTIVWLNGEVLGKPEDKKDAKRMLGKLSGKKHLVITGVCLTTSRKQKAFTVTTEVEFADLTDEEIDWYVERYEPLDKAGAYGIQEWIGYVGVKGMNGSFYNVMGLPVQRLYTELQQF